MKAAQLVVGENYEDKKGNLLTLRQMSLRGGFAYYASNGFVKKCTPREFADMAKHKTNRVK